jgi:ribosomal protein L3
VDLAKNALLIRGGIPGPNLGYVVVRTAIKTQLGQALVAKPLINRQVAAK